MKKKRFKHDVSTSIIGMSFNEAKSYCISEGYQLQDKDVILQTLNETYLITVLKYGDDDKIIETKYGK